MVWKQELVQSGTQKGSDTAATTSRLAFTSKPEENTKLLEDMPYNGHGDKLLQALIARSRCCYWVVNMICHFLHFTFHLDWLSLQLQYDNLKRW